MIGMVIGDLVIGI